MTNNEMQNQYNNPPQYSNPQPTKSIGLALASMIVGIVSLLFCLIFTPISILCSIAGVIMGTISLGAKKGGKGMAIAGIACSGAALLFLMFWVSYLFR